MRSEDLTTEQAAKLRESIRPMLAYLHRLRERMTANGFLADDKLFRLVNDARNNLQDLNSELHRLSCKSGVGRPRREN